ncbi:UPF0481 protein At3g47200-like [Malania oleifera]|uniref:UPF0481 protein At3g47200-like n=1 Tax=Malania oleifera TaxID=397392 RepID=UPI0025AE6797|nr:UPF0481 protein At3g47200-like [Malania oleifera]
MNGDHDGDAAAPKNAPSRIQIQRVPKMLREVKANRKCYSPRVVSFGPFHSDKELQVTEKTKMKWARHFISHGKTTNIDEYYARVEETAKTARHCYEYGSTNAFDDDAFARMMFLDGCFILQFVDSCVRETHKDMNMKSHDVAFVTRDLFLLENQVPFVVLKCLTILRYGDFDEGMQILQKFIKLRLRVEPVRHQVDPLHLLDLLRTNLLGPERLQKGKSPARRSQLSFRSSSELKSKGIYFRRSKTACLKDVSFEGNYLYGMLWLPAIVVDDSTKSTFLNLIAYETCPDAPDDSGVTSYVVFMDSLIDHARDVEELRLRNILVNFLGSDEEVATLFNEIATDLVPNMNTYDYVSSHIGTYYSQKWKSWTAEVLHDHFSSPWTAIAFLAAVLAISLSAVQTYFTVLSYLKSPSNP